MQLSKALIADTQDLPLLDPASCGENLLHNAARISELAPAHCKGCADYHIRSAAHRCTGIPKDIAIERPQLIELIRNIIRERADATTSAIEIVIPGSADTGILSTCAHAAATLGATYLNRCRFTVLDLCPTPLILCHEYATRHHLSLRTFEVDLTATPEHYDADLIVAHSLLRFINHADQVAVLDKFGSWLKSGGRLIVSNRLKPDGQTEREAEFRKRTAANSAIAKIIESGALRTGEPSGKFLDRLQRSMDDGEGRPGEIRSLADARSLFARSQLREISLQNLTWKIELAPDDVILRNRVLAVLCKAE